MKQRRDEKLERLNEPPVRVDAACYERLRNVASNALSQVPEIADHLLEEIERAEIVPSGDFPSDAITIGSRVTYCDESSRRRQRVQLVFPEDADIAAGRISVLTPVGAALIGLSEGDRMAWRTPQDDERVLRVEMVERGNLDKEAGSRKGKCEA